MRPRRPAANLGERGDTFSSSFPLPLPHTLLSRPDPPHRKKAILLPARRHQQPGRRACCPAGRLPRPPGPRLGPRVWVLCAPTGSTGRAGRARKPEPAEGGAPWAPAGGVAGLPGHPGLRTLEAAPPRPARLCTCRRPGLGAARSRASPRSQFIPSGVLELDPSTTTLFRSPVCRKMVLFWGWALGVGVQAWVVECEEWSTPFFSLFSFFQKQKRKSLPTVWPGAVWKLGADTQTHRERNWRRTSCRQCLRGLQPADSASWFRALSPGDTTAPLLGPVPALGAYSSVRSGTLP